MLDLASAEPHGPAGGAVEGVGPDAGVAAHYGRPLPEQRALARGRALVDLSHRAVLSVSGPDRLTWLHTLGTQHVADLPAGTSTEILFLDAQGRIE
ncbi:MAG: folate-binding protein, partial [Micrococcaceae bacterium]|nr:folate-binding protein [Micrococcaceae bacterium]